MVKFPGTQAYDGGVRFFDDDGGVRDDVETQIDSDSGNKLNVNGTTMTFKEYLDNGNDPDNYYYSYWGSSIDDDACLRDINQLLKHLYKEALSGSTSTLFNDEGKVVITAFCDEYTYLYDPRTEDYIHPGTPTTNESDLLLWKEYVNTNDRVLNITPMVATDYSEDMNTSITHSFVKISQMAIKTIYNENDPELKTAWGLETTNETGPLTWDAIENLYRGNKDNTSSNGRTNFLNFWLETDDGWFGSGDYKEGDINWTAVMTVDQRIEDANGLNDNYRDAFHACITRNRDLNGNNKIEENEIYWYLAAKDQLSGLYIGQPALEESAWMYTGDGSTINHLVTSSFYINKTTFWILWSEEGASWGELQGGGDQNTTTYDYRCIRNLGIPINDYTPPSHYAEISGLKSESGRNYHTIDVGVINSRALRSAPDDGDFLPLDHERSQNNQPFRSFDVLSSDYPDNGDGITWTEMRDKIDAHDNTDICPEGWRPPNQREFLIMMSLIDLSGNLGIATTFSFDGVGLYTSSNRYGFLYTSPNLRLYNDAYNDNTSSTALYFRCVRDTPSAY